MTADGAEYRLLVDILLSFTMNGHPPHTLQQQALEKKYIYVRL
jgi:hypothetical protein